MKEKVLVLGATGMVGSVFLSDQKDNFDLEAPASSEADILNPDSLRSNFDKNVPDWVINFSAYTKVEEAENQKNDKDGSAFQLNVVGVRNLALVCRELGLPLFHISTEYVFDGTKSDFPYEEDDEPNPINWYGMTKFLGEEEVLKSGCDFLLARISMPYTHFYPGKSDIARTFHRFLSENRPINALVDVRITPTLIFDINECLKLLIQENSRGVYHLATPTPVCPYDFAKEIDSQFGFDSSLISPVNLEDYNSNKKAAMLKYSWLSPQKFVNKFGDGILHPVSEDVALFKKQNG